jgi:hypothetical protein
VAGENICDGKDISHLLRHIDEGTLKQVSHCTFIKIYQRVIIDLLRAWAYSLCFNSGTMRKIALWLVKYVSG